MPSQIRQPIGRGLPQHPSGNDGKRGFPQHPSGDGGAGFPQSGGGGGGFPQSGGGGGGFPQLPMQSSNPATGSADAGAGASADAGASGSQAPAEAGCTYERSVRKVSGGGLQRVILKVCPDA